MKQRLSEVVNYLASAEGNQTRLARKLGTTQPTISRWIDDKNSALPLGTMRQKIAARCGMSRGQFEALLEGEEPVLPVLKKMAKTPEIAIAGASPDELAQLLRLIADRVDSLGPADDEEQPDETEHTLTSLEARRFAVTMKVTHIVTAPTTEFDAWLEKIASGGAPGLVGLLSSIARNGDDLESIAIEDEALGQIAPACLVLKWGRGLETKEVSNEFCRSADHLLQMLRGEIPED